MVAAVAALDIGSLGADIVAKEATAESMLPPADAVDGSPKRR